MLKPSIIKFNSWIIQVLLGISIGSLCYIFNSIIKNNINFVVLFILITLFSYYIQKRVVDKLIINISSTSELIGNSIIISIHSFVFWSLLLNIF